GFETVECKADRDADRVVSPATTDVGNLGQYVVAALLRLSSNDACRRHDEARLAIAALRHGRAHPCIDDRPRRVAGDPLNRRDGFANRLSKASLARARLLAIDNDGAGPAQAGTAPELGPHKLHLVPQRPEEWRV